MSKLSEKEIKHEHEITGLPVIYCFSCLEKRTTYVRDGDTHLVEWALCSNK